MFGSSGAEALSRATGDEQLLKTQALTNNQQKKRHPDDEKKHRDDSDETPLEVGEDSFESTVATAQNQHIQEIKVNMEQSQHRQPAPPQRMRAGRKTVSSKLHNDKQERSELNKPVVDDLGHLDVSG
ncbi:hypothetical protein JYT16_00855 [Gemmatimonas aurantiaca]|nr:hypothetical protein [Gemmatimonas aurantiaca]